MSTSDTRYRLLVAGRLSETAAQLVESRFGSAVAVGHGGPGSTVDLTGDQPALRALLTLLWDLGHDLVGLGEPPDRDETAEGRHPASPDAFQRTLPGPAQRVPHAPGPVEERLS